MVRNPPASAGAARNSGWIPGSGRVPGEGNDDPLQYSCLGNPMDRGAWWATVHRVAQSPTRRNERTYVRCYTGYHRGNGHLRLKRSGKS